MGLLNHWFICVSIMGFCLAVVRRKFLETARKSNTS
nr:MAG TPA: hypothetical protein [Caudoviricetes sp.]